MKIIKTLLGKAKLSNCDDEISFLKGMNFAIGKLNYELKKGLK